MGKSKVIASRVLCMVTFALLTTAPNAFAQNLPDSNGSANGGSSAKSDALDEIVVTALRRETDIQKTPESMTAVQAESLSTYGKTAISDLENLVPSLNYSDANAHMQLNMRGVGLTLLQPGGDPGVAFYDDGVYVADPTAGSVAFMDVDRIEVLRGPQPALYGRDAVGGAVSVVSAAPTSDLSADLKLTGGDFGRADVDGYVSGPLGSSGILGRLSVQEQHNNGFTPNLIAGTAGAPGRVNQTDTQAARLQLQSPVGTGTVRVTANYSREDDNGPTSKVLPESYQQPAQLLFGARPTSDPNAVDSNYALYKRRVWSLTGRYEQPFSGAKLTVIADTRGNNTIYGYDLDGTTAPVFLLDNDYLTSSQHSIEAYLSGGTGSKFEWLFGGTYLKIRQFGDVVVPGLYPLGFLTGNPAQDSVPFPATINVGGTVQTVSSALYGDGTLALTDWLSLRTGVRYSSDKKHAEEFLDFAGSDTAKPNAGSWGAWTGRIGLAAAPTDGVLYYFNVARGYKSGAINLGAFQPPVKPEFIDNYELGAKYTSPGRWFLIDADIFHAKYTDMQVVQVGAVNSVLTNAAQSTINGSELELTIVPLERLHISASAAYLHAIFDNFTTGDLRLGGPPVNVAGNPLPLVSKWQVGLGMQYTQPLAAGGQLQGDVHYAWRDKFYFSEFNDPLRSQGAYGLLDMSLAWQSPTGRWRLFAFVDNLTNKLVIESMNVVSPLLGSARVVDYLPPRNFGVGVEIHL